MLHIHPQIFSCWTGTQWHSHRRPVRAVYHIHYTLYSVYHEFDIMTCVCWPHKIKIIYCTVPYLVKLHCMCGIIMSSILYHVSLLYSNAMLSRCILWQLRSMAMRQGGNPLLVGKDHFMMTEKQGYYILGWI